MFHRPFHRPSLTNIKATLYIRSMCPKLITVYNSSMCWQVELQSWDDAKLIGMCIYNVAVLSMLGSVAVFVIDGDLDLLYGFISTLVIAGTMLTSSIVFVPKVSSKRNVCPDGYSAFIEIINDHSYSAFIEITIICVFCAVNFIFRNQCPILRVSVRPCARDRNLCN